MKKILALALAMLMVLSLCACGAKEEAPAPAAPAAAPEAAAPVAPAAAEATWADYQAYLIEKAGSNAPDLAEFEGQVYAINSWEELDQTVSPWDQMFTTIGLSTWEEFAAGVVKEPAVMGSDEAAAGDASGEPAGDASGEPSAEAPAAAPAAANEAHGGTPGAVSDADYQAYLKAFIAYEDSVNEQMTAEQVNGEFIPMIESGAYDQFPVEMMFTGMLNTGAAMTFDQFVAANGVY